MNDLLNFAMTAHGGLERWKQVRNMQAKVTLNGTLWRIKGRPDGRSGVVMRLKPKQPDLTITPFPKPVTTGSMLVRKLAVLCRASLRAVFTDAHRQERFCENRTGAQ